MFFNAVRVVCTIHSAHSASGNLKASASFVAVLTGSEEFSGGFQDHADIQNHSSSSSVFP